MQFSKEVSLLQLQLREDYMIRWFSFTIHPRILILQGKKGRKEQLSGFWTMNRMVMAMENNLDDHQPKVGKE
jgi:hypothetical protein